MDRHEPKINLLYKFLVQVFNVKFNRYKSVFRRRNIEADGQTRSPLHSTTQHSLYKESIKYRIAVQIFNKVNATI
jgi:hypothetical protein